MRELTNAIVASGNALLREAGRLFKGHGLSAAQFNVLDLLSEAPRGLRPSELTAALVVDPSSTTYVMDRMEKFGWLRRVDDKADRRAWRISLTPAGRKLHAVVYPRYRAALREVLRTLPAVEVAPLTQALEKIRHAAHAAVDTVLESPPATSRSGRRKPRA